MSEQDNSQEVVEPRQLEVVDENGRLRIPKEYRNYLNEVNTWQKESEKTDFALGEPSG